MRMKASFTNRHAGAFLMQAIRDPRLDLSQVLEQCFQTLTGPLLIGRDDLYPMDLQEMLEILK